METISEAQRAPRCSPLSGMNVIRSSEMRVNTRTQGNEDLFASQDEFLNMPFSQRKASVVYVEQHVTKKTAPPQVRRNVGVRKNTNSKAGASAGGRTSFVREDFLRTKMSTLGRDVFIARIKAAEALNRVNTLSGAHFEPAWLKWTPVKQQPKLSQFKWEPRRGVSRGGSQPVVKKERLGWGEAEGLATVPTWMVEVRRVSLTPVKREIAERRELNRSVRNTRMRKETSWGDRYRTGGEFKPALWTPAPKTVRSLAEKLQRIMKVKNAAKALQGARELERARSHLTGTMKFVLDHVMANPVEMKSLLTQLGKLQGQIASVEHGSHLGSGFPAQPLTAMEQTDFANPRDPLGLPHTPLHIVFDTLMALCGINPDQVTYHGFIHMVKLLTVTTIPQAILEIESIINYTSTLPVQHSFAKLATYFLGVLAQIGLGAAMVFQADYSTFLSTVIEMKNSPLSTKMAAAFLAAIPSLTAMEEGTLGYSVVGAAMDRLRMSTTPHVTAFGTLVELLDVLVANIQRYTETGDIRDLIGRDSSTTWIMDADAMMAKLSDLRTNFKGKDIRGALSDAKALYEKGIKSKHPLVLSKTRELQIKIKSFEEGLAQHRTPPVAVIAVGPPGCGKTVFLERLAMAFKKRMRIDPDVKINYEYSATNFQAPPSILSILTLNDFFQMRAESPKLKVDPMDLLQKLADSAPLDIEGASLELKNVYIRPDFIIVTTNTHTYQFSNAVGGINKLDRRYLILKMEWTAEFTAHCNNLNRPYADVFRERTFRGHPVRYTLGRMINPTDPNNQVVNFEPVDVLLETFNLDRVIGFLLTEESKRENLFATRFGQTRGDRCQCGLLWGSGCPCEVDFEEFGEGVDEVFQGGIVSHQLTSDTKDTLEEATRTMHEASINFRHAMNCLPGGDGGFDASINNIIQRVGLIAPGSFNLNHVFRMQLGAISVTQILGIVATMGAVVGIVKFISQKFAPQGLVHSTPSFPSERPEQKLPPFHATQAPYLRPTPAAHSVRISRISKGIKVNMHAIVLSKFWLIVPKHFFEAVEISSAIEEGDEITMSYLDLPFTYRFSKQYLYVPDPNRDRAYLYNPCMHSVSAGIFNLLPEHFETPNEPVNLGEFRDLNCWEERGHIAYKADTQSGSCGQALVGSRSGVIYGFHHMRIFGMFAHSEAEPLSKTEARKVFKWGNDNGLLSEVLADKLPRVLQQKVEEGGVLPGLHPRSDASWFMKEKGEEWPLYNHVVGGHFASADKERFSVHPTTIHERFKDRCKEYGNPWEGKAVKQEDGTWQSATTIRLNAAKNPPFNWVPEICNRVVDSMVSELDLVPTRPLTDFEALCGVPEDVMMNPKDTTKSIGPTPRLQHLRKEEAFKKEEEGVYTIHPLLLQALAELQDEVANNEELLPCLVQAQGKDEAYPLEKSRKGRKRLFYISDWVVNHETKKYIQPIISLLIRQPYRSGMFISINAASEAWTNLAEWLESMSKLLSDADFSSFDMCHRFVLIWYLVYVLRIAKLVGYTNPTIEYMRRLFMKRNWYVLLLEGNLLFVLYMLCSGWVDTIIVNCFVVNFIYRYAYFKRCWDMGLVPRPVREVMRVAAVGDDSIAAMRSAIHHILNPALLQVEAKLMGYAMTSGDKSAVMKFTELANIVFLKRGFRVDGRRVWAPLSTDSIYKSLAYSTGRMSNAEQRARDESAAGSAIREMFLHGKQAYDELRAELLLEFPMARFPDYDELLLEYDAGMFETWKNIKSQGTRMVYQAQYEPVAQQSLLMPYVQLLILPLTQWWLTIYGGLPMIWLTANSLRRVAPGEALSLLLLGLALYGWDARQALTVRLIYAHLTNVQSPLRDAWRQVVIGVAPSVEGWTWWNMNVERVGHVVGMLLVTPLVEEIVKREPYGLIFPVLEFLLFSAVMDWRFRVAPLLFHYSIIPLHFPWAVFVHGLWNLMSMNYNNELRGWLKVYADILTIPIAEAHNRVFELVVRISPFPGAAGGGVVYHAVNGASLYCPTPGRGAHRDFPVPTTPRQTGAYSLGCKISSTELNSLPQDVGDMTTNATHITMINGDSTALGGTGAPYDTHMEQGYAAFFGRPRRILEFSTPLATVQLNSIMSLWRALPPVAEMRSQWGLFRGRPKITISYTGNASFNGLVRVFFYPAFSAGYSSYQDPSYPTIGTSDCNHVSTSNLPHIDLDMAQSCTCEMELPYIHNKPYHAWADDWFIGVRTINTITTASGVTPTSVKIAIMVSYHDVALSRIQYQGAVEVQGGVLSRGLALAASLSRWFTMTTPYTKMLELGSKAAYSMGYSRAVEPTTNAVVSKRFGALGYMTGEASFGTTLGSDPLQSSDMSGTFSPGEDVDSVTEIARKWSQLLADWTLAPIGVNPAVIGWENASSVSHTHLGNVSIMFERWSGKLEYRIQFVCSSLIRWRLGIVYVPIGVATPTSFPTDGSYVTHIVEAAGSTDYVFQVDYIYDLPYQDVQPVGVYSPTTTMGKLVAFSLSDPAGPSATSVYPSLNVWVRAGDGFSLSVPSTKHLSTYKQYQSACERIEVSSLGEKVDSLRMLSKRKCHMANISFATANGNKFTMPADGYPGWGSVSYNNGMSTQVNLNDSYFTFDTYIRQLFFGYRGGSAYTMYAPGENSAWIFGTGEAAVGSIPTFPDRVNAEGRGGALYFPDFNKVNELIVPDRSGYTFKGSVWNQFYNPISGKECLVGFNQDTLASPAGRYWVVHQAAGDDRTYTHYLGYLRLIKR